MLRCEAKPGVEVLVQKKVRALKEAGKTWENEKTADRTNLPI